MSSFSLVESIFDDVLQLADPAERKAYLDRVCQDDSEMRSRIDLLLSAHAEGEFLESPPAMLATAKAASIGERPGDTIGAYKLLEQIGEGGMGLVFVAEQFRPLRRRVALKIIKPGLDTRSVIARFEAERQALALMDHPNIARVYDAGATETGRPYFVMELVRGAPITGYCQERQVALRERLKLFIEVCHAVQHAHQKGVIHRDLKPSNILVSQSDTVPVPKVIDFGVAKAITQQLTEGTVYTGFFQVIGTPLYMSPEQADQGNQDVDTRSDVYSLGVVLYELLTGTTPFDAERLRSVSHDEMRRIIREEEPPKPSTRATTQAAAPATTEVATNTSRRSKPLGTSPKGDLDWVVMKCLEKDRRRRYESPSALGADITRYLSDEAVLACPPSGSYRVRKFVRRHRSRIALGLIAMVLCVGTIAAVAADFWQAAGRRQLVRQGLGEARTAIEAADLTIAESRTAESETLLQALEVEDASLEAEIASLEREIEARRAEQKRFEEFVKLADDAQQRMWIEVSPTREGPALRALAMYGVRTDPNWLAKLDASYLDAAHKSRVKHEAYFLLVSLANSRIQWNKQSEGVALIKEAEAIKGASRASLLVQAKCLEKLEDKEAATRTREQARATPATSAWDYLFEAYHLTAKEDLEAAVAAYQAALRIQPDHYVSLYGFADRLATEKDRLGEAIQLYTGCIALRPDHSAAYRARANALVQCGDRAAAELDATEAIRTADTNVEESEARRQRLILQNRPPGDDAVREDLAQIVESHREELEEVAATLGPENEYTLMVRRVLADAQGQLDPSEKSLEYFLQTFDVVYKVYGADHEETGYEHRDLACLYERMGKYPEAIEHWTLAHRIRVRVAGANSADTIMYLDGVARATHMSGDIEGAIKLFEEAFALWRETRDSNPGPSWLLHNAGAAYLAAGRLEEALPLYEQALEKIVADRGLAHPLTKVVAVGLASCYSKSDGPAKQLALVLEVLEAQSGVLGTDHPDILTWRNNLAFADFRRGRVSEAISVQEALLPRFLKVLGPGHRETIQPTLNLADYYHKAGRNDDALALLEGRYQQVRDTTGPPSEAELRVARHLATAFVKSGKPDDARSLLRGYWTRAKELKDTNPDGARQIVEKLEDFYRGEEYENAADWERDIKDVEEVYRLQVALIGLEDRYTLCNVNMLALAYYKSDRKVEGLALMERTAKQSLASLGPADDDTAVYVINLADMYFEEKRTEEAMPILTELWDARQHLSLEDASAEQKKTICMILGHLGDAYDLTGRCAEATLYWRLLLEHTRMHEPAEVELALASLVDNLLHDKSKLSRETLVELEPLLRELLTLREKSMPDDWRRYNTMSRLGGVLSDEQRYAEAEPLLLEGYAGMEKREAKIPSKHRTRLDEAIERLVGLYEQSDRPEEADRWREKLTRPAPEAN